LTIVMRMIPYLLINEFVHCQFAGIAQLVERCLAKAKVAGSSPVSRSMLSERFLIDDSAESLVAVFHIMK
jgi:hypothetical protein